MQNLNAEVEHRIQLGANWTRPAIKIGEASPALRSHHTALTLGETQTIGWTKESLPRRRENKRHKTTASIQDENLFWMSPAIKTRPPLLPALAQPQPNPTEDRFKTLCQGLEMKVRPRLLKYKHSYLKNLIERILSWLVMQVGPLLLPALAQHPHRGQR